MDLFRPEHFFDLAGYEHAELFAGLDRVWEALGRLRAYLEERLEPAIEGEVAEGAWVSERVYVAPGARVEPGAWVKGPAVIGPGTVVRHGAYIREYCLIGRDCVVGHATELKGTIMLDGAQAPHFNYVGDSILGRAVNLGAGTKLSNLRNDDQPVAIRYPGGRLDTGLRKLGAILGDGVKTGCNVVTNPGTLIGPHTLVYPGATPRGYYPPHSILKVRFLEEQVNRR